MLRGHRAAAAIINLRINSNNTMKNVIKFYHWLGLLLCFMIVGTSSALADTVKGTVADDTGEPLIGATVALKGNSKAVTVTDIDGNYSLVVPSLKDAILEVSYVGMESKEVKVAGRATVNVTLTTSSEQLDEVIVVGYGQQKKASIVGAITQTSGEVLEKAGGVSSLGAALTGNLPGVITSASSGMPGDEDPEIIIRAKSSWNNSAPLVLSLIHI